MMIAMTFVFSYTWALAGNLDESSYDQFDSFIRHLTEDNPEIKVSSN